MWWAEKLRRCAAEGRDDLRVLWHYNRLGSLWTDDYMLSIVRMEPGLSSSDQKADNMIGGSLLGAVARACGADVGGHGAEEGVRWLESISDRGSEAGGTVSKWGDAIYRAHGYNGVRVWAERACHMGDEILSKRAASVVAGLGGSYDGAKDDCSDLMGWAQGSVVIGVGRSDFDEVTLVADDQDYPVGRVVYSNGAAVCRMNATLRAIALNNGPCGLSEVSDRQRELRESYEDVAGLNWEGLRHRGHVASVDVGALDDMCGAGLGDLRAAIEVAARCYGVP